MRLYEAISGIAQDEYITLWNEEYDLLYSEKKRKFMTYHIGDPTKKDWKKTAFDKYGMCKVMAEENGEFIIR